MQLDLQSYQMEIMLGMVVYRFKPLRSHTETHRSYGSLVYYISGGHAFTFSDCTITARAGQMLYLPYGSAYRNYTLSEDTEYYQFDFNMIQNGETVSLFDRAMVFSPKESIHYLSFFQDIYQTYTLRNTAYQILCIGGILRLVGTIANEQVQSAQREHGMDRIEKTVQYLNEHYDRNTSLAELAELSSTCISNLEKAFKHCLGVTPLAYRNQLRMTHAKRLLAGGCSIQETAQQVGITDIYYFSRLFKRICGTTPGTYVRSMRSV